MRDSTSLPVQYFGYDRSKLRLENVEFSAKRSWVLADFFGSSELRTINSPYIPTETYPHDSSTIWIEGARSDNGVWLEFRPLSKAILERIPEKPNPFNLTLGRGSAEWENVDYQVNVVGGIATFGVISSPRSDVTVRSNGSRLVVGYTFIDVDEPQLLSGVGPGPQNGLYTHQGRTLRLVDAALEGFAWQIYASSRDLAAPQPVRIVDSTINEIGAMANGRFEIESSVLQWALLGALGEGSTVLVKDSTINSQTILAEKNGIVRVESSDIFGSLVQARDSGRILLMNTALHGNVCHPRCLPVCPPHADGGCNPFSKPGQAVRFLVGGSALILALRIEPAAGSITRGEVYELRGDLFLESAADAPEYSYNLLYRRKGSGVGWIVRGGVGPKRDAPLGSLDTTTLPSGDYIATLELVLDGTVAVSVERPFSVVDP